MYIMMHICLYFYMCVCRMRQGKKTSELPELLAETRKRLREGSSRSGMTAQDRAGLENQIDELENTVVDLTKQIDEMGVAYNSTLAPIDKIQYCLRVKTSHFDGLVRAPLTGPRISMAIHICLESPLYTVSENTIKSGIRFILGSLYRFWSKRCDFRSVRHLIRSRFFIHGKALKTLHN